MKFPISVKKRGKGTQHTKLIQVCQQRTLLQLYNGTTFLLNNRANIKRRGYLLLNENEPFFQITGPLTNLIVDYQNVELLLIDNGAEDLVSDYILKVYEKDKNIALIKFNETQELPEICTLKINDDRLIKVGELLGHNKLAYPEITFKEVNILSIKNKAAELKEIESIQNSYGLLLVIKCFENNDSNQILKDIDEIITELIFSDTVIIENIIKRRISNTKGKTKQELENTNSEIELLENLKLHLEKGEPLNSYNLPKTELKKLGGYNLITLKPIFILLNYDEDKSSIETNDNISKIKNKYFYPSKLEMELSELPENESAEFRTSLNIKPRQDYLVLKSLFEAMGKILFITAGDQEIKGWEINKGDNSLIAASKIHSDISKGFIRAEVIEYNTFIELGSWNSCKKEGKVKGNGKEYIVNDGDIINFLHS